MEGKLPVNVDLSAKASLELKAELPPESAGRIVDCLLDMIRPYTEKQGLKGDLIKLEREKVLLETLQLSQERMRQQQTL